MPQLKMSDKIPAAIFLKAKMLVLNQRGWYPTIYYENNKK